MPQLHASPICSSILTNIWRTNLPTNTCRPTPGDQPINTQQLTKTACSPLAARGFSNPLIISGLGASIFTAHIRCHEIPMPPVRTFGAMTTIVKQKARNLSRWSLFLAIMNHFSHHRYTKQPNSVTMVPSHHKTRHLGRFMIENRPRCRFVSAA